MKIYVYAIAKNERKFVERWYRSMSEADGVFVLDTGSDDGTADALMELGAKVTKEDIVPWRFDEARNRSLELVPADADICVCTDLDEVFECGWRKSMEDAWHSGAVQARYRYIWSHTPDGGAGVEFYIEKAHARYGFKWVNPVHEVLSFSGKLYSCVTVRGVTLHHYPDSSKSRASYLPLLELAVRESPYNDRNMHYLGREYMFYGRYDEAIETLMRHLALPSATWAEERAASMRYIAKCYQGKGRCDEAARWLMRAIAEAPSSREALVDYARLLFEQKNWYGVIFVLTEALAITSRSESYINSPECWGALPYDLISLAYYYVGSYSQALDFVREAIKLSDEPRLKDNERFFLEKCK